MTGSALAELAWPDLEQGREGVLVVPLGATEQHGPHLPLSTDSEIAEALARAVAERLDGVTVAPLLAYGASGEHEGFPGTVSIGAEALELLLVELCRSATTRFERVLLLSAHGGNAAPLRAAVERLRAESRDVRAWGPSWDGDAHAGRTETSLMLALAPEQVRLPAAAAGNPAPLNELLPALRASGVRQVAPNGVLGDPAGASAEEGLTLLAAAADELAALIAAWGDGG